MVKSRVRVQRRHDDSSNSAEERRQWWYWMGTMQKEIPQKKFRKSVKPFVFEAPNNQNVIGFS